MTNSKEILKVAEDKMKKAVEVVREELVKIRTGKATTALLDGIKVDYYGTLTPLNKVANVSIPDVHTVAVQPWEKNIIPITGCRSKIRKKTLRWNRKNPAVSHSRFAENPEW